MEEFRTRLVIKRQNFSFIGLSPIQTKIVLNHSWNFLPCLEHKSTFSQTWKLKRLISYFWKLSLWLLCFLDLDGKLWTRWSNLWTRKQLLLQGLSKLIHCNVVSFFKTWKYTRGAALVFCSLSIRGLTIFGLMKAFFWFLHRYLLLWHERNLFNRKALVLVFAGSNFPWTLPHK